MSIFGNKKEQETNVSHERKPLGECLTAVREQTPLIHNITNYVTVNDVANAIYEEANATMLSGETAMGIDPVLVVQTMATIIDEIERYVYDTKMT